MSKRRFFQLHLSTAVVLMLVAGVLVWANVQEANDYGERDGVKYERSTLGWPIACRSNGFPSYTGNEIVDVFRLFRVYRELNFDFVLAYAVYNVLIALAILLALWQLCEWRVRRKQSA